MTVKEIVNLLPTGHPFRIEIDNEFSPLITKDDYCYNTEVIQEYDDYNVIEIYALDGVYKYDVLWLKVKKNT